MVQLVSIDKIEPDEGDSSLKPVKNGEHCCTVEMGGSQLLKNVNKSSDVENGSSIYKFCCKRNAINLQWKDISLTTKRGEIILKKLSGAVYSGELTAIMGPSGAGKTSLLNVLSGFTRHKVSGQILVNGVNRDMRTFRMLTTYILQDDHILPRLTVREIVSIAASLKIPSSVSRREKEIAVDDCLQCLGLVSHQNQRADKLSGGQRKRLCIAQEIVSNPPMIFLDEPTSGLDSSSCLQCIQLLKALAKDGRTVVCTVHQPSSRIFEVFDKLYMLAEGQCIYRGTIQNLIPFLSAQELHCPQYHNPADYVTEVAVGDYGHWTSRLRDAIDNISKCPPCVDSPGSDSAQDLKSQSSTLSLLHENKSSDVREKLDTASSGYATSSYNQFKVLFYRNILCTFREPTNMQLKFLGNSLLSVILGGMFYGIGNDAEKVRTNTVLLFCTITFLLVCASVPSVFTFPLKRRIFERELMNSWYSTGTYYLSVAAAEFPFQVLYPVISGSIVYWMSHQPSDMFRFGLFLLSLVLLSLVAESVGQLIGAGCEVTNGAFIVNLVCIHTVLFCGFFITTSSMLVYLRWVAYTSFGRYAFHSMMLATYSMDRPPLHCPLNVTEACRFRDPVAVLKKFELEGGELHMCYVILLVFILVFRIATYLILRLRTKYMWTNH